MARIAFISLYNKENLGISYLSACLRQHGHIDRTIFLKRYSQVTLSAIGNTASADHMMINGLGEDLVLAHNTPITEKELSLLFMDIESFRPDFIGFSVAAVVENTAAGLTQLIKKRFPTIAIIWGGITPTTRPTHCIETADIVCIGEGEGAIVELAHAFDENRDYDKIANLWVKRNGRTIENEPRPLIQDLDSLPFPAAGYENKILIDNDQVYEGSELLFALSDGCYEAITGRGCPFLCSYCCNKQLRDIYPKQKYMRRRSPENVISELKLTKAERQPYFIFFQDDIFTFNSKWIKEFSERYKQEIDLPFWCNVHPRYTKEDVIVNLKKAGLHEVTCGIQSGSEQFANEIYKRRVTNRDVIDCARLLYRLDIKHNFDLITNNPLETEDSCRQTLDLLLSLPSARLNSGISKLSIFPGTEIETILRERSAEAKTNKDMFAFFNYLYLLVYHWPGWLIRYLSKSTFFRRRPRLLKVFFIWPRIKLGTKAGLKARVPKKTWIAARKLFVLK